VTKLYQMISTDPTFAVLNSDLKPENDYNAEIAVIRKFPDGNIRLSVFNDYVKDTLISQTGYLSEQTPYIFVTNVDTIRNTGVELDAQKDNVLLHGLDFFGSVTCVNSEILSDPSFASNSGNTADGKKVPYVPDWRVTFWAAYHPDEHWSLTAVLRYSGNNTLRWITPTTPPTSWAHSTASSSSTCAPNTRSTTGSMSMPGSTK
jgi:iron complex outermembrane receptor protein